MPYADRHASSRQRTWKTYMEARNRTLSVAASTADPYLCDLFRATITLCCCCHAPPPKVSRNAEFTKWLRTIVFVVWPVWQQLFLFWQSPIGHPQLGLARESEGVKKTNHKSPSTGRPVLDGVGWEPDTSSSRHRTMSSSFHPFGIADFNER